MRSFDVIIVGNGVLGMTLARSLTGDSPGLQIAVVGPPRREGSASLAAGAMINVWAELGPGALDDPAQAAKFNVARQALNLWADHAGSLSQESSPVSFTSGTYILDSGRGTRLEEQAFDYLLKTMAQDGISNAQLSLGDMPFLDPDPQRRPVRAVLTPDAVVDSWQLMTALDTVVDRSSHCQIIPGRAVGLESVTDRDKGVRLDDGQIVRGAAVVLANGPQSQPLIDQIPALKNTIPRLLYGAGTALDVILPDSLWISDDLRQLNCAVRTLDRGAGCGVHLIPRRNRAFYFGSSSHIWIEPEAEPRLHAIEGLCRSLRTEFHHAFFHARVSIRRQGFRPVSSDAFPLLGESSVPGLWFLNGTKRDGLTCSPFLAAEMAKQMTGRPSLLPELFRPVRPMIPYGTRRTAVEAAVQARIGSEIIHGLSLPTYLWDDWTDRHRRQVEEIYDRRQIQDFGIHPELLHLYDSDIAWQSIRPDRQ